MESANFNPSDLSEYIAESSLNAGAQEPPLPRKNNFQYYMGTKLIQAAPSENGYDVLYSNPDGSFYKSSSPKEVFESAYLPMGGDRNDTIITPEMVSDFIVDTDVLELGNGRTTIVVATLKNGFVIVESATCVAEETYNVTVGKEICMRTIHAKVYELLGFTLAWATRGV